MNTTVLSLLFGPIFLACFFVISFFAVYGIRTFVSIFVRRPQKSAEPERVEKPAPPAPKKKRVSYRTLRINPDDVDKIYIGR